MPKTPATKPQDKAISDTTRGLAEVAVLTEDQKRAAGIDAGADAEPHSYAPEDNAGSGEGTVLDSYAGAPVAEHANASGEAGTNGPLAVGMAPQASARPVRGSQNGRYGEKFDPEVPNAIMQSPVIRGPIKDIRNDPNHPEHDQADKQHPDYGLPASKHLGVKPEVPSFQELKNSKEGDEPKIEGAKAQPGAAVA